MRTKNILNVKKPAFKTPKLALKIQNRHSSTQTSTLKREILSYKDQNDQSRHLSLTPAPPKHVLHPLLITCRTFLDMADFPGKQLQSLIFGCGCTGIPDSPTIQASKENNPKKQGCFSSRTWKSKEKRTKKGKEKQKKECKEIQKSEDWWIRVLRFQGAQFDAI